VKICYDVFSTPNKDTKKTGTTLKIQASQFEVRIQLNVLRLES